MRALVASLMMILVAGGTAFAAEPSTTIEVSPDGHFLMEQGGQPFFWLADTGWELFQRLDREEADRYLQDRARKGFTVIQAVIGGVHAEPNHDGQLSLLGDDFARPNAKYFANVDWVIDRARQLGLHMAIVPFWAGRVLESGGQLDARKAEIYGHWLGSRYRDRGILWILGGDVNPLWPKSRVGRKDTDGQEVLDRQRSDMTIIDHRPIYDAVAHGLQAGEGGHSFITYHPTCCGYSGTAAPRTSLYFGDRGWLTMNMLQSSHYANPPEQVHHILVGFDFGWIGPLNYAAVEEEYRSLPIRPVVDGEARFEDLGVDNDALHVQAKGYWNGYDARNAAYHAVFAGAAGHTYGNHSVWQFYDPKRNQPDPPARLDLPWQQAIDRPVASQMHQLKDLMLSRPYFGRIPDQSLLLSDPGSGTQHIGATRDRSGSYEMIYSPQGQPLSVDLNKLAGPHAIAWWFDPRTGAATRIGVYATGRAHTFIPPSTGTEDDWVLVVDDEQAGFSAPGVRQLP